MPVKIIGHIVNTYGLDGSIKVNMETDVPEVRFAPGESVTIDNRTYKVSSLRMKNHRTGRVKLEGLDDVDRAVKLVGKDILKDVEPLPGTYFIDDLIGLDVLAPDGRKVATVARVQKLLDEDYFVLDSGKYIPFKVGIFTREPDLENHSITLTDLGLEATL